MAKRTITHLEDGYERQSPADLNGGLRKVPSAWSRPGRQATRLLTGLLRLLVSAGRFGAELEGGLAEADATRLRLPLGSGFWLIPTVELQGMKRSDVTIRMRIQPILLLEDAAL